MEPKNESIPLRVSKIRREEAWRAGYSGNG